MQNETLLVEGFSRICLLMWFSITWNVYKNCWRWGQMLFCYYVLIFMKWRYMFFAVFESFHLLVNCDTVRQSNLVVTYHSWSEKVYGNKMRWQFLMNREILSCGDNTRIVCKVRVYLTFNRANCSNIYWVGSTMLWPDLKLQINHGQPRVWQTKGCLQAYDDEWWWPFNRAVTIVITLISLSNAKIT